MIDLKSMSLPEMEEYLRQLGEPRFRAGQVFEWIQSRRAVSFDGMTNLSKGLREKLGSPNIGIKQDDSTEYGYFYEIVSENGEPRYVYIQTDSELGNILWALICTPHEVDDKHPLYEKK